MVSRRHLLLIESLGADPDRTWLVFETAKGPDAWTIGRVTAAVAAWSARFDAMGLAEGDRAPILLPNSPSFVAAFLGAARLGAIPVPLPWPAVSRTSAELRAQLLPLLDVIRPKVFVTTRAQVEVAADVVSITTDEMTGWPDSPVHTSSVLASVKPEQPMFLQFTSGTTKLPRGATISHAAASISAQLMAERLGCTSLDVGVSWLPFFHDMGLVGGLLCSLAGEFPLHVFSPGEFLFRPRRWLEVLTRTQATLTVAPNFAYELVRRRVTSLDGLNLSRLRLALSGSEPVLRSTIDAFETHLAPAGLRRGVILPVYGLAEATLGVAFASHGGSDPDWVTSSRPIPSVGTPLEGFEVELRHPDGSRLDDAVEGEIWVRGPTLMSSYFEDKENTARALQGGWLRTGDLGIRSQGRLYITGREKDVLIKAGRKFHAAEIEQCVREVVVQPTTAVAAFAVTDPNSGTEAIWVLIEVKGAIESNFESVITRALLARLDLRVDRVMRVSPGELPRTTSGKIQRRACAVWAEGASS